MFHVTSTVGYVQRTTIHTVILRHSLHKLVGTNCCTAASTGRALTVDKVTRTEEMKNHLLKGRKDMLVVSFLAIGME